MILFGTLFAINVVAGLVALAFFIIGLADGTVTSFNILIWAAMLGVVFSMPWAAWAVRLRGRTRVGHVAVAAGGVARSAGRRDDPGDDREPAALALTRAGAARC